MFVAEDSKVLAVAEVETMQVDNSVLVALVHWEYSEFLKLLSSVLLRYAHIYQCLCRTMACLILDELSGTSF